MAVTGQEIDALRQQQEALSESLSRTQDALLQNRRQLAEENRAALARLQEETEKRVTSREKQLKGSYEKLLGNAVSAQEAALAAEYSRMQQQYESVTGELNAALAQEQRQTEEMLLRQHEFEQAYYARQRFAGKRAEECRHKAEHTVQEAVAAAPVEWFFPGHLAVYNARLRELRNYYENGFFESVIGISENLMLSVQLDRLETERQFRRWQQYYAVMCGILGAQRRLLFEDAVRVPAELVRFSRSKDILDGSMSRELLDYWTDGAYSGLTARYEKARLALAGLEQNGCLGADETALRAYMNAHPADAEKFPAERLYRMALRLSAELTDAEHTVRQMRMRMRLFEERAALLDAVRGVLRAEGYPVLKTQMLGKPGDPLLVQFCDDLHTMQFEVMLIPVLRRADDTWLNQAVLSIPDACGQERRAALLHVLAEVFAAQGIELPVQPAREEQSVQERLALAMSSLQMKINGRLN